MTVKRGELLFVFFLITVLIGITKLNILVSYIERPADVQFLGITHYYPDYFLYLDQIRQGQENQILTNNPYSYDPSSRDQRSWLNWFNPVIGYLSKPSGLSPWQVNLVALVFLLYAFGYAAYYVSRELFPVNRLARLSAFVFILTTTNLVDFRSVIAKGTVTILGFTGYTPTFILTRFGGVPHQLFQTIVFMLLPVLYFKTLTVLQKTASNIRTLLYVVGSLCSVAIATSVMPVQTALFLFGFTITLAVFAMHAERWRSPKILMFWATTAFISTLIAFAYLHETQTNVSYIQAMLFDRSTRYPQDLASFLYSFGPILLFCLVGLVPYVRRVTPLKFYFALYGLVAAALFCTGIPDMYGVPSWRVWHPANYIFFGLLAGAAVEYLLSPKSSLLKKFAGICLVVFYILNIVLTGIYAVETRLDRNNSLPANSEWTSYAIYNYVPDTMMQAFTFLNHTPATRMPVVLTDPLLPVDSMIPVFTGKYSFTGHPLFTLEDQLREDERNTFFTKPMPADEVKSFLTSQSIGFLFVKNNVPERAWLSSLPFLRVIYRNPDIIIYRTNF